jgi:hypothetical protein
VIDEKFVSTDRNDASRVIDRRDGSVLPARDNCFRYLLPSDREQSEQLTSAIRNQRQRSVYESYAEGCRATGKLLPSDLPSDLLVVHRDQMTPALELPNSDVRKKNIPKEQAVRSGPCETSGDIFTREVPATIPT